MKSLLLLTACGLALTGLVGCAPMTPPTARVALDCPTEVGNLKLSNIAPDKKSCLYAGRGGDEVTLRLVSISGNYEAALRPIETELQGEIASDASAMDDKAADAKRGTPIAKAAGSAASDASAAARQAAEEARNDSKASTTSKKDSDDEDSKDSDSSGDHAHIDLPGIHISADDDKANVNVAGVHVDAGENGATVRMSRDVRLRGEALSPERRGFRSTFILARDDLKDGWRSVGYEAAGPKAGPITVAVFKAREGHHDVSDDIKKLVRRNGGV
jgi:hypothetical protein